MDRRWLWSIGGLLAGLAVLALFLHVVGPDRVAEAVAQAAGPLLLVATLLVVLSLVLLGLAWWAVVGGVVDLRILEGLRVFFVGHGANLLTPFGQLGGEPIIAVLLANRANLPLEEGVGAALAADLINTAPFFTFTITGVLLLLVGASPTALLLLVLQAALLLFALIVGGAVLLWRGRDHVVNGVARFADWLRRASVRLRVAKGGGPRWLERERIARRAWNFYALLDAIGEGRRRLAVAVVLGHLAALVDVAALAVLLAAASQTVPPVAALLFILPASMLATFLPLPGGVGGVEVALAGLLHLAGGVPLAAAGAAALLFRVLHYGGGFIIAGVALSQVSESIFSPPGERTSP